MPGGFGGGGGQTQPATFSQGANPAPYIPAGQGAADQSYQSLLQGFVNPSMAALNNIGQLPAAQYYPFAQTISGWSTNNPYFPGAQQAAGLADQYGQAAGTQAYSTGMNAFPFLAGNVTGLVPDLQSGARGILSSAFDPQQALYNQLLGQNQQQLQANLAYSGLAGTPYGAGLANDANRNFAMDWQSQLLGRQAQGLGAAGAAAGRIGGLEQTGADILGQGTNLANMGVQGIYQFGQLPYQQLNQYSNQGLSSLGNLINLGNQQFTIPEDTLSFLNNYLGLGRNASLLAGQLGQAGFNQNQTGFGNMVGAGTLGSQLLFGGTGPFGANGLIGPLFGGGGLFGGGFGGAGLAGATAGAAGAAGSDFGLGLLGLGLL